MNDVASSFFMMSQIAFLVFVTFTAPMVWRRTKGPVHLLNG